MKPTIDILSLYCDTCMKTYDTKKSYIHRLVKLHEMILQRVYSEPGNFDSISLYCKVCDIMYKNMFHYIHHLRRIHHTVPPSRPDLIPNINDKNNYCIACDATLCNRTSYLQHMSSIHLEGNPKLYQGINCKNPSKEDISLKKYCADCHKVSVRKILYHIHLDKIHGIKPLNCSPTADDPDVNNSNNHYTLCDKTFQRKSNRKHMTGVHNMLVTRRRTIINRNATPVVDLLKNYCNVCDRVYKTSRIYQSHLSRCHHIKFSLTKVSSNCINRNAIPSIGEIDNVCSACDKTYANRTKYKEHLHSVHDITLPRPNGNAPQVNRNIIPDFNKKKNHCASCNRTYSSRPNYKRHLAEIHNMREENIKQEDQNEKLNIRSVQTN